MPESCQVIFRPSIAGYSPMSLDILRMTTDGSMMADESLTTDETMPLAYGEHLRREEFHRMRKQRDTVLMSNDGFGEELPTRISARIDNSLPIMAAGDVYREGTEEQYFIGDYRVSSGPRQEPNSSVGLTSWNPRNIELGHPPQQLPDAENLSKCW
jgi:hypothetical protein